MNEMKGLIAKSFRMEMIGTGVYRSLAAQYSKSRPKLSAKFRAYADQEFRHGRMFDQCHRNAFGQNIGGGAFWRFIGRVAAFMMRALPLKAKMKKLSRVEFQAVADIEKALAGGDRNGLEKVLRAILPDEKAHAALYGEWFPT
ncbi:MAG: hypothetical protein M0036_17115 [Desulfobacteraceae bacterium]|nr:hypothetical protein [Desulfobacteraceae bacterium]